MLRKRHIQGEGTAVPSHAARGFRPEQVRQLALMASPRPVPPYLRQCPIRLLESFEYDPLLLRGDADARYR